MWNIEEDRHLQTPLCLARSRREYNCIRHGMFRLAKSSLRTSCELHSSHPSVRPTEMAARPMLSQSSASAVATILLSPWVIALTSSEISGEVKADLFGEQIENSRKDNEDIQRNAADTSSGVLRMRRV